MTDGNNTLSQGGSESHLHESKNEAKANERTLALCDGAKSDEIQIYTIGYRLQDASDEVKTVLQNCASSPAHYFDASNAKQLKETFRELAGKLDFTRLSI